MTLLRHLFPTASRCPSRACNSDLFRRLGTTRSGALQYRRCYGCGQTYRVPAGVVEVIGADGWSVFLRPDQASPGNAMALPCPEPSDDGPA